MRNPLIHVAGSFYIVNIDEGSRSDFMLQNSKRDVFSIVTEYVEVRQSFLFAFVELIDTIFLWGPDCTE